MPTPNEGGAPAQPKPNARDELIARMAARVAEARTEEEDVVVAEPDPVEEPATEPATDPVAATPPVTPAAPDPAAALAEFLVVSDGKPMLKLKVDGEERLVPFDTARATLQKHEAADRRLQQAAALAKDLKAREEALQAREAEFSRRDTSGQPPSPGADDPSLDDDAKQLAHTLLNATEDEVAATLKKVLSRRQATPAVNPDEIVTRAVQTAEQRFAAKAQERDIAAGWTQFQRDYPDIAADSRLFTVADGMTDEIAAEHPEYSPAQVMSEAGKRTRAWLEQFKPAAAAPASDRQTRKEQLRPMPQARSGKPPVQEPEKPKTQAEILAEIRKSRGQAV